MIFDLVAWLTQEGLLGIWLGCFLSLVVDHPPVTIVGLTVVLVVVWHVTRG